MKSLCPECGHLHAAKEPCPKIFFNAARLMARDRKKIISLIPEHKDMTLDRAFEIVLAMAWEHGTNCDVPYSMREQIDAINLVTAYHLLNVKG